MKKEREENIYIYGKHPVGEALRQVPDALSCVFVDPDMKDQSLLDQIQRVGVEVMPLNKKQLPGELQPTITHQGVIAVLRADVFLKEYKEFITHLEVTPETALLILGEVQDPHNVGAVIRSAAAFGIAGVLIPPYNQAPVNGTVVKVSAGMAFRVPLVTIPNVNTVIRDLKERGFWTYGLDGDGETKLHEEKFTKPSAFVLGNEGTGLRKKTKEACDTLLSISIDSRCESLNAAVSASTTMYTWSTQH